MEAFFDELLKTGDNVNHVVVRCPEEVGQPSGIFGIALLRHGQVLDSVASEGAVEDGLNYAVGMERGPARGAEGLLAGDSAGFA